MPNGLRSGPNFTELGKIRCVCVIMVLMDVCRSVTESLHIHILIYSKLMEIPHPRAHTHTRTNTRAYTLTVGATYFEALSRILQPVVCLYIHKHTHAHTYTYIYTHTCKYKLLKVLKDTRVCCACVYRCRDSCGQVRYPRQDVTRRKYLRSSLPTAARK